MKNLLVKCELCPRCCGVNRCNGGRGFCKAGESVEIFRYGSHYGEEPPISGINGSGTIFFSRCTLKCVYCQNYPWSQEGNGQVYNIKELTRIFRDIKKTGCHNWNLVSPTPWLPQIEASLEDLGKKGALPVVYNTSGFEKVETLVKFKGLADIYLVDLRYASNRSAEDGSGINEYVCTARVALAEMWNQVGPLEFDRNGIAVSGVICRLLILPGRAEEVVKSMKWIASTIGTDITLSIMSQYLPTYKANKMELWNNRISMREYSMVCRAMKELDFSKGWIQDFTGEVSEDLIGFNMKENKTV